MDNTKTLYTRIQHRRGTAAEWEANGSFVPLNGELIVYTPTVDGEVSRIKMGDGRTTVVDLPFLNATIEEIIQQIPDNNGIIEWDGNEFEPIEWDANNLENLTSLVVDDYLYPGYYDPPFQLAYKISDHTFTPYDDKSIEFLMPDPLNEDEWCNLRDKYFFRYRKHPYGHAYWLSIWDIENDEDEDKEVAVFFSVIDGVDDIATGGILPLPVTSTGLYCASDIEHIIIKPKRHILDLTGGDVAYQQLVTDNNGDATWEDRLYYEEYEQLEIIPEFENERGTTIIYRDELVNQPLLGANYKVCLNNYYYDCTAVEYNEAIVIGNLGLLGGNDTGEPFYIAFMTTPEMIEQNGTAIIVANFSAPNLKVSVTMEAKKVAKYIDGKYLVSKALPNQQLVVDDNGNVIWEEKPFYEGRAQIEILPETTIEINNNYFRYTGELTNYPVIGATYTVLYNNVAYDCTAVNMSSGGTGIALGNLAMANIGSASEEPFCILFPSPDQVAMAGGTIVGPVNNSDASFTLSVSLDGEIIKQIDEKFIPNVPAKKIFYTNNSTTTNGTIYIAASAPFFEIGSALADGKVVVCSHRGIEYSLISYSDNPTSPVCRFGAIIESDNDKITYSVIEISSSGNTAQIYTNEITRGSKILMVTTAPTTYTTTVNGFTPAYRISKSTVISQTKVSSVSVGDIIQYSFYHYPIRYINNSYIYLDQRTSMRGNIGPQGPQGDTPIKGTDYWTESDKEEIVQDVLEELPAGSSPHQYLTTDADGEATWEDKLCYEEHVVEEVIPETTLTYDENQNGFIYTQPINNSVVIGENYSINYNGTLYDCVAFASPPLEGGVTLTALGNGMLAGMENDTGEPFIIIFPPSEMVAALGAYAAIVTTDGAEEITIAINLDSNIVAKKIDPKFIPNGDFLKEEKANQQLVTNADGKIVLEERLCYGPVDLSNKVIIPETELSWRTDADQTAFNLPYSFRYENIIVGREYKVTFNGVEYNCDSFETISSEYPIRIRVIGDLEDFFFRNTEGYSRKIPFDLIFIEPIWEPDYGPSRLRTYDGSTSVTFSLAYSSNNLDVIKKIDPTYLPEDFFLIKTQKNTGAGDEGSWTVTNATYSQIYENHNRGKFQIMEVKIGEGYYYLYPTFVGWSNGSLRFSAIVDELYLNALLVSLGERCFVVVQQFPLGSFGVISVNGEEKISTNSFKETLDFVAGENVAITTDIRNKQITISATPQEGTTYSAGTGLAIDGTTINHSNSITAKTTYNQATASPGYGGTFKITEPKYDAQGHITGTQVATITMPAAQTIPTSLKNPEAITIGSKTYDGSAAVTIEASDLGLSNALHFIGVETSLPASGTNGDVVLVGSKEYVYSNGWVELGDGDSHALKTVQVKAGNGLTGGGAISGDVTISHGDTSSVANVTASANKFITGLTFDTYGHVTGATTGNVELTYSDVNAEQAGAVEAHAANTTLHVTAAEHNNIATALAHANAKGNAYASGLYKITSNSEGHITAATAVTKADITALGIPAQDTTYTAATTSKEGLMSAADKVKLNKVPTTIQLTGAATGSATFNGSATLSIATTVNVMNVTQTSGDWLILDCN